MPLFGPNGELINETMPPTEPLKLPEGYKDLGKKVPMNDEMLVAAEVIGRCSVCSVSGTLEWPGDKIPFRDAEKIIAYKPLKAFCPRCQKDTLFLPIEVKKYTDTNLRILKERQDVMRGRSFLRNI